MKTIIMFLALVTALFAQTPSPNEAKPSEVTFSSITVSSINPKVTLASHYDIVWMGGGDAGMVMSLNGIPEITPLPSVGANLFAMKQTARPEKPEEVTVTLWTKDGKKWAAKWQEAKP